MEILKKLGYEVWKNLFKKYDLQTGNGSSKIFIQKKKLSSKN